MKYERWMVCDEWCTVSHWPGRLMARLAETSSSFRPIFPEVWLAIIVWLWSFVEFEIRWYVNGDLMSSSIRFEIWICEWLWFVQKCETDWSVKKTNIKILSWFWQGEMLDISEYNRDKDSTRPLRTLCMVQRGHVVDHAMVNDQKWDLGSRLYRGMV